MVAHRLVFWGSRVEEAAGRGWYLQRAGRGARATRRGWSLGAGEGPLGEAGVWEQGEESCYAGVCYRMKSGSSRPRICLKSLPIRAVWPARTSSGNVTGGWM